MTERQQMRATDWVLRKALDIITFGNPDALVFFMGIGGFFWGLWLVLPWPTFASTPTFALLEYMAPELFWGYLIMALCTFKIYVLLWSRNPNLKIVPNAIMAGYWFVCFLSFVMSNWQSTASVIYFFFFLSSVWVTYRRYVQSQGGL